MRMQAQPTLLLVTGLSCALLLGLQLLPARAQAPGAEPSFEDLVLCGEDLELPNLGEPCGEKGCSGTMRCDEQSKTCTWKGVPRTPQSAADCGTACSYYGDCDFQLVDDPCTGKMPVCRPSAAGCAAAELCAAAGRCGFDPATTTCTVTIAGCAASRHCKDNGLCHPSVVVGFGERGWECKSREDAMQSMSRYPDAANPGDPAYGAHDWLEPYPLGKKRPKTSRP